VRDWCANAWTEKGPPLTAEGRLVHGDPHPVVYRSVRGGAFQSSIEHGRLCARFADEPAAAGAPSATG
jgi:hypothetical protein